MGHATVAILLHHRPKTDGTRRVRLRVTKDRVVRWVETPFTVLPAHWNDKAKPDKANWFRSAHPDHVAFNARLRHLLSEASQYALNHPEWSAEQLQAALGGNEGEEKPDVVRFFGQHIERSRSRLSPGAIWLWERLHRRLVAWRAGEPWHPADMKPSQIEDFYGWLRRTTRMGAASTALDMGRFGTVVRRMIDDGLLLPHQDPFLRLTFPQQDRKLPQVLSPENHDRLMAAALPTGRLRSWSMQWARRAFHLQFLVRGLRVSDALRLRWGQVGPTLVSLVENKTGKHKVVKRTAPLNAFLEELLAEWPIPPGPDEYILPYLTPSRHVNAGSRRMPAPADEATRVRYIKNATEQINEHLALWAEVLGIPRFTSHTSRHTYSTFAYRQTKDLQLVQQLLNHSSPEQTQRYLRRLERSELLAADDQIYASGTSGTTVEQQMPFMPRDSPPKAA